ncbi:hypothetical protein QVD17_11208 [Tagetes erecta]|uniref:Uncharacterized protein n=1 Tax=Tagetes erecta TaxID=13708 RepID=A0AAD8KUP9_TARER|nr:hypothetical protein QVD17_11208 [Tagetes erecta]
MSQYADGIAVKEFFLPQNILIPFFVSAVCSKNDGDDIDVLSLHEGAVSVVDIDGFLISLISHGLQNAQ